MADYPLVVTVEDVTNPNLLVRVLRTMADRLSSLGSRLDNFASTIKFPSMDQIRSALIASGSNPINVTGLRGVLADPQPAAAIRYFSAPIAQELQALKDTQLITVKNGTAYDLYTVIGGNPNTLFKLIGSAGGGNMMTTDTTQTVTATKTFSATQNFSGTLNVTSKDFELNGAMLQSFVLNIKNNAGTIQHSISTDGFNGSLGSYASKITGASATFANTPQVAAGVDFTSGGGVNAAVTNDFVLNVAAQTVGEELFATSVAYNDTTTSVVIDPFVTSINVNGTTRNRVHLRFRDLTGAAFNLTAAGIAAGKQISVRFYGHIF